MKFIKLFLAISALMFLAVGVVCLLGTIDARVFSLRWTMFCLGLGASVHIFAGLLFGAIGRH